MSTTPRRAAEPVLDGVVDAGAREVEELHLGRVEAIEREVRGARAGSSDGASSAGSSVGSDGMNSDAGASACGSGLDVVRG